jgi:segregation and condensation protein B
LPDALFAAICTRYRLNPRADFFHFRYDIEGTYYRMSLKAKLEAVIYAAEEPVTLAQLAALFAVDALEWKAEEEAASAALAALQPYLGEEFALLDAPEKLYPELDSTLPDFLDLEIDSADIPAETVLNSETPVSSPADAEASPETPSEAVLDAPEGAEALPEGAAAPEAESVPETESASEAELTAEAALELRRIARLRDREVRVILRQLLDELIASYAADGRGVEIREIAGGFRMATKPECHDAVSLFVKSLKPALKLSLPALETLAIIAYKQPVTAPEINEIRGVDSSGVFGSLLARKLITSAGRKPVIGRPILYKTTREFLLRFGLKDVAELPSMEEFEKLAAGELDEPEPEAGEDSAQKVNPALGPEFDEAASEKLEDSPSEDLEPLAESPERIATAETAAGNKPSTLAEAAPAAPPPTEQAETETYPHDEEKD